VLADPVDAAVQRHVLRALMAQRQFPLAEGIDQVELRLQRIGAIQAL